MEIYQNTRQNVQQLSAELIDLGAHTVYQLSTAVYALHVVVLPQYGFSEE